MSIIKKYFGKNTELAKELQLYNSIIKEQHKSEARALDYIRTIRESYNQLNQSVLKRQRYNLVKEISENFMFERVSKIHINNYKALASIYMLFEYKDLDNPKRLMECKNAVLEQTLTVEKSHPTKNIVIEEFSKQDNSTRLLTYKLMIDKFNDKYSVLSESQKQLLNKYITNVNDTEALREYVSEVIPTLKARLADHVKHIDDKVTQIKVERLSEMLCNVETMKRLKESHIVSLMRYMDLIDELNRVHK